MMEDMLLFYCFRFIIFFAQEKLSSDINLDMVQLDLDMVQLVFIAFFWNNSWISWSTKFDSSRDMKVSEGERLHSHIFC